MAVTDDQWRFQEPYWTSLGITRDELERKIAALPAPEPEKPYYWDEAQELWAAIQADRDEPERDDAAVKIIANWLDTFAEQFDPDY